MLRAAEQLADALRIHGSDQGSIHDNTGVDWR